MITFLVPTVNKTTLSDGIETIKNQSSSGWKIIVGGDGMMPKYVTTDASIEVYCLTRRGEAGLMRNALARLATTEWIGFLDDDDELHPDYVKVFEENKDSCDVMLFNMMNYGEILPPLGYREIRHGRLGISFAMKRQLLLEHPFDGQGAGEDYRMLYTLQNTGYVIKFLDFIGYYVRPYLER